MSLSGLSVVRNGSTGAVTLTCSRNATVECYPVNSAKTETAIQANIGATFASSIVYYRVYAD